MLIIEYFLLLICTLPINKKRPPTLPKQADGLTLKQPVAKIEIRLIE
jgi:hypothetical protein